VHRYQEVVTALLRKLNVVEVEGSAGQSPYFRSAFDARRRARDGDVGFDYFSRLRRTYSVPMQTFESGVFKCVVGGR
jgi:hypothetical protein